jgi:5-methylcytosine-specific restriction protein B
MEPAELAAFLSAPKAPQLDRLAGQGQGFGSSFVAAAADTSHEVPAAIKALYQDEMLLLFNLLQEHNAEFGYRVGYEAARFLYFYQLLGGYAETDATWFDPAMDAVIIQKLLPKLHGSRTRMEGLLWALAWACGAKRDGKDFAIQLREAGAAQDEQTYGPEALASELDKAGAQPRYPLSYEKIMRMWRKLVREQFVSFAEA